MAEKDVGALVVMEGGSLAGIISERDYARKVILHGKSSHDMPVRDIMTARGRHGRSVAHGRGVHGARDAAPRPPSARSCEDEQLIGVLSIGDLVKEVIAEQEQTIKQLESLHPS